MTDADFCLLTTDTDRFMRERGYATVMEYGQLHGLADTTVRNLIRFDNLKGAVKVGNKWYVPASCNHEKGKSYLQAPDGYMTIGEAAKKWFMTTANVHILVKQGNVPGVIRNGCHTYIPVDAEIVRDKKPAHETPEGYLTTNELAEKWYFTPGYIRALIADGKLPGVLTIKGRKYIPKNVKMPSMCRKGAKI